MPRCNHSPESPVHWSKPPGTELLTQWRRGGTAPSLLAEYSQCHPILDGNGSSREHLKVYLKAPYTQRVPRGLYVQIYVLPLHNVFIVTLSHESCCA